MEGVNTPGQLGMDSIDTAGKINLNSINAFVRFIDSFIDFVNAPTLIYEVGIHVIKAFIGQPQGYLNFGLFLLDELQLRQNEFFQRCQDGFLDAHSISPPLIIFW